MFMYLFLQKAQPEFSKTSPGAARVWTNVGVSLQSAKTVSAARPRHRQSKIQTRGSFTGSVLSRVATRFKTSSMAQPVCSPILTTCMHCDYVEELKYRGPQLSG